MRAMVATGVLLAALLASRSDAAPPPRPPELTSTSCLPLAIAPLPGQLDQFFGRCGARVTTAPGSTTAAPIHYTPFDLAILPDDRIIVVGRRMQQVGNNADSVVLRYTASGSLDGTFGTGGAVVVNASGSGFGPERARAVLVQTDGAIVVAGESTNETIEGTRGYIFRLTPAGALDPTFGVGGITQIPATKGATDVASDGAGGFYVSGRSCSAFTCSGQLTRVLANGSLDPAFGAEGTVSVTYAGGQETAEAIAFAPGGVAVAGLTAYAAGQGDLGIARFALAPSGLATPDRGFSGDGKLTKSHSGQGAVSDVVLNADLGMTVAGATTTASGKRLALTRITPAGVATTTTAAFPGATESGADALARTPTRIYAAGHVRTTAGAIRMALAAYTTAGALDTSFSGDGLAHYFLSGEVRASGVGVQSSGRVIVVANRVQTSTAPGAIILTGVTP